MEIERQAEWGSAGDAAAPFMDLLSRIPDNDETGRGLTIRNPGLGFQQLPEERPGADAGSDAWIEFLRSPPGGAANLPPGVIMMWPTHLDRYVSAYPDLWDHLGFDGRVVEIAAGAYPAGSTGTGGGSHGKYEVAVGDFDPGRTAAAISGCGECPAPETLEHSGVSYYAWPGGLGDLRERTSPPLYDHIGRAPRLLVQEDAAYFSWEDGVIPEFIDTLQGHSPSLAEDQEMTMVIERLAELGAVGTMDVTAVTVSIEEATFPSIRGGQYSRSPETQRRAATKAPLLKPFEMLGHGAALDDEGRFFLGIVALHQDGADAQENADRMEQRLKESAFDGRETSDGEYVDTPWSELIERVEMSADGAALMVKLYPRDRRVGVRASHPRYETLFLHEAEGEG